MKTERFLFYVISLLAFTVMIAYSIILGAAIFIGSGPPMSFQITVWVAAFEIFLLITTLIGVNFFILNTKNTQKAEIHRKEKCPRCKKLIDHLPHQTEWIGRILVEGYRCFYCGFKQKKLSWYRRK